jgi:uncharacterized protein YbgA (DUF1722 family)/uncharacterized protein YbbK (DUF523 family)
MIYNKVMEKIKIGISACLLGEKVRYDGGHQHDHYVTDTLGAYFNWVSVCPEVEYGLSIPREPMRLVGDPAAPRLITVRTGIDHTEGMLKWAEKRLRELNKENLCGFIFKSRSPSSGIGGVKVYTEAGMPSNKGKGLFGGAFMKRFPLIPAIDDGRLHDPQLRENFTERVFVYKRWQEFLQNGGAVRDLIIFHTNHKLLLLAHSQKHYRELGRFVANIKEYKPEEFRIQYITLLMNGLQLLATTKKNTNVLLHIVGYFKENLSSDEKQELIEVIENYHKGFVPLIVPVILIRHYVRKFDEPYLKNQYYLNPHPIELMLRNHV